MYMNCNCQKSLNLTSTQGNDNIQDLENNYTSCNSVDECSCGFDDEESFFPSNPMFGHAYVPNQRMTKTFTPSVGLKMGTIFPELVSLYSPNQSIAVIEYLKARNEIGEGCNR